MRSLSAQQPSISVLGEAGDFALNRTAASAGFSHAFRIDGRVLRRGLAPVVTLGDDATGSLLATLGWSLRPKVARLFGFLKSMALKRAKICRKNKKEAFRKAGTLKWTP